MEFLGEIRNVITDWVSGETQIIFSCRDKTALLELDKLRGKLLSIQAKIHREKRSKDANGLLWACCSEIGRSMNPPADKWDVYLEMLKRYGIFTHMYVAEDDIPRIKQQWRELEVISSYEGTAEILCYYGSHTYNTAEFSVLLNGIIGEMEQMGLPRPTSKEMTRSLDLWEKQNQSSRKI